MYLFLPLSYCIPCIPLYILCTHVYPSNTVYLVYPCVSCLPMFTLVILYTLYTPMYLVYTFTLVILYTLYTWEDIPETLTVVLTNKVKTNSRYFVGVFSKTITLLALVGYEIIITNSSLRAWLPTTISLHTRSGGIIVKSPVYPCIFSTVEYPVILCNILFTHVNSSILYTMFILFTHAHPRTVDSMTICR